MSEQSSDTPTQKQQSQQPAQRGQQPAQQDRQRGGQPPGGQPRQGVASGGGSNEVRFVKFGLVTYLLVGLGLFVSNALTFLLSDDDGAFGVEDDELFFAASEAYAGVFLFVAPLLGIAMGVYYYQTDATFGMPAKAAAIASAVGVLAAGLLLVLLTVIFEPDAADVSLGDEIAGLLGITLGTVVLAAGTGFVLENDPLDIF